MASPRCRLCSRQHFRVFFAGHVDLQKDSRYSNRYGRFYFTCRYIEDVLSINNPSFKNYLDKMHPVEPDTKDTTACNTFASYLDLLPSIGRNVQFYTSIYEKKNRHDFYYHITNVWFLSSYISSSPAYGVFISKLICPGLLVFI